MYIESNHTLFAENEVTFMNRKILPIIWISIIGIIMLTIIPIWAVLHVQSVHSIQPVSTSHKNKPVVFSTPSESTSHLAHGITTATAGVVSSSSTSVVSITATTTASQPTSTDTPQATSTIQPTTVTSTPTPQSGPTKLVVGLFNSRMFGGNISLWGYNFVANETVKLFWNYQQQGQFQLNTVTAKSDGSFSIPVTIPSDPDLGTVNVGAVGTSSKWIAISTIQEIPNVLASPMMAQLGTTVQLNGGGFGANEVVKASMNGVLLATATTDRTGAFTAIFVPTLAIMSTTAQLQVVGQRSGVSVTGAFSPRLPLAVNPTSGSVGTPITVSGSDYSPSSSVDIYWLDWNMNTPKSELLTTVTTSPTGAFSITFSAPYSITGLYPKFAVSVTDVKTTFTNWIDVTITN